MSKSAKSPGHKIALYIRVSTEEQAANPEGSIKSQEQRLRQHVELRNGERPFGEVTNVYVDRALSGKDTNRPQLQKLLSAIRRKEVTLVLVTELSRLSRSIKDFSEIWEMMRECKCEFQSLREQFDTTTAAGEMVLFMMANFAQFERKQVSERVKANLLARAERGLSGGSVPFGYEKDSVRSGHLCIKEDEAEVVKELFATFLREGCMSKAGKSLNDRGYRKGSLRTGGGGSTRISFFTVGNMYFMLTNKSYIGLRVYKKNGEENTAKACWPAIIDEEDFARVQEMLAENRHRYKASSPRRYPYILSGLVVCGQCGDRMTGKSANGNGGKIAYYEHGWATKRQAFLNKKVFTCQPHRVLAKKLEPLVWSEIMKLLSTPKVAESIIQKAHDVHHKQNHVTDLDKLRNKVEGIGEQINALAEHLTTIPKGLSPAPIYEQMQKLQDMKVMVQKEYEKLFAEWRCA